MNTHITDISGNFDILRLQKKKSSSVTILGKAESVFEWLITYFSLIIIYDIFFAFSTLRYTEFKFMAKHRVVK